MGTELKKVNRMKPKVRWVLSGGLKVVRRGRNVEGKATGRVLININMEEINWNIGYSDGKI